MKVTTPSPEAIIAYRGHNCTTAGHTHDECDLACPWCGDVHGFDGYCSNVACPNYKGNMLVDADSDIANHQDSTAINTPGFDLERYLLEPYSPLDTSSGDPRLHVYRRLALAAFALELTPDALSVRAAQILHRRDYTFTANSIHIDSTPVVDLEHVASMLEHDIDRRCC